jgi:hypothetical protein
MPPDDHSRVTQIDGTAAPRSQTRSEIVVEEVQQLRRRLLGPYVDRHPVPGAGPVEMHLEVGRGRVSFAPVADVPADQHAA